jgi:hypothetical protein
MLFLINKKRSGQKKKKEHVFTITVAGTKYVGEEMK